MVRWPDPAAVVFNFEIGITFNTSKGVVYEELSVDVPRWHCWCCVDCVVSP
jgi:hypothetical protein